MTEKEQAFLGELIAALNKCDAGLVDFVVDEVRTVFVRERLEGQRAIVVDIIQGYLDHFDPDRVDKAVRDKAVAGAGRERF